MVLPAPFEPISPVNSPGAMENSHVIEDLPPGQPHAEVRHAQDVRSVVDSGLGHDYSTEVETWSATAFVAAPGLRPASRIW